jgi:hypothetical protein
MAEDPDPRSPRTSRPLWLVEGVDLVDRRRGTLLLTVGVVAVLGALAAWFVPEVVPPSPLVGASIGIAGVLLGIAAIIATDATEAIVRGPRHVGTAGGELVAVLPAEATVDAARPLAGAVTEARRAEQTLLLGISAAGRDAEGVVAWVSRLAEALAEDGASVLALDLVTAPDGRPGLLEFTRGERKLPEVVEFVPGVRLATLASGADRAAAIDALPLLRGRLPRDLEVLVVALPPAANRQVVRAARTLDHVLLLAQRDVTAKVDLIASLDAMDAVGTHAQVVLLDDRTASALSAGPPRVGAVAAARAQQPDEASQQPGEEGEPTEVAGDEPASDAGDAGRPDDEPPAADPVVETSTTVAEDEPPSPAPGDGSGPGEERYASDPREVDLLLGAAAAAGAASLLTDGAHEEDRAQQEATLLRRPDLQVTTHPVFTGVDEGPAAPTPDHDADPDVPGASAPDPGPERELAEPAEPDPGPEPELAEPAEPDPGPEPELAEPADPDPGPEPQAEPAEPDPGPEPELAEASEPAAEPQPEPEAAAAPDEAPEAAAPDEGSEAAVAQDQDDGAEPTVAIDSTPPPAEVEVQSPLIGQDDEPVAEGPPVVDAAPTTGVDDTDRLPRVVRPQPVVQDDLADDLLRTTAQLAVLLDDLEDRGDAAPPS